VYIKYLLLTPPKMVHNLSGGRDTQVENHCSTSLRFTKPLRSCRMLLATDPKFEKCNEAYLGEREG